MPRIRNIKPEFWDSPSTARADLAVRLVYIALWNWADDSGHGTANLKELEAFCFPNDEVTELPRRSRGNSAACAGNSAPVWRNFAEVLGEVAEAYGVTFYRVAGRPFYRIDHFKQHQSKDYRSKSKYPGVDQGEIYDVTSGKAIDPRPGSEGGAGNSAACAGNSAPTAGSSATTAGNSAIGTGEQGNRGEGDAHASQPDDPPAAARRDSPSEVSPVWLAADAASPRPDWVRGTVDDPRCPTHEHLAPDAVPACTRCRRARDWLEAHETTVAEAERQARREARDACPVCHGDTIITLSDGRGWRCPHDGTTPPKTSEKGAQSDEHTAPEQSPHPDTSTRPTGTGGPF